MSTLLQLSNAAGTALADAELHGASIAAHFLRVHLPELFREARHAQPIERDQEEYQPGTAPTRQPPTTRRHKHA